jgi:hypothetical protein
VERDIGAGDHLFGCEFIRCVVVLDGGEIGFDDGSAWGGVGEESRRAGVGKDLGRECWISSGAGFSADRAVGNRGISAQFEIRLLGQPIAHKAENEPTLVGDSTDQNGSSRVFLAWFVNWKW